MADFVKFGQAAIDTIKAVGGNINEADVAAFLCLQQDTIQDAAAEARRGGAQAGGPQGGRPAGQGQSGQASSAMERLRAKMGR